MSKNQIIPSLIFATSNDDKKREVNELLNPKYEILSLADLHFNKEIPEPFDTLEENSKFKTEFLFKDLQMPCFAEDTGLEVTALNMKPGVKSARYAGLQRSSEDNIKLLLHNLKNFNDRSAQFRTVATYYNGHYFEQFEGIIKGHISNEKKGSMGFGYDSIFIPLGYEITFAEMDYKTKNLISHRGIAIKKLIKYLQDSK